MKRSDTVSFVESGEKQERRAYCRLCEDLAGQFNKLVPRYINGIRDDKFKVCSYCGELYPIYDVKYFTEYEPKGYISNNPFDSGSRIAVKDQRRRVRKQHRNNPLPNEDIEIPKFAGKKDVDLERMVKEEGAILNSIVDSWTEDDTT